MRLSRKGHAFDSNPDTGCLGPVSMDLAYPKAPRTQYLGPATLLFGLEKTALFGS